jgi:hypothetical protein
VARRRAQSLRRQEAIRIKSIIGIDMQYNNTLSRERLGNMIIFWPQLRRCQTAETKPKTMFSPPIFCVALARWLEELRVFELVGVVLWILLPALPDLRAR